MAIDDDQGKPGEMVVSEHTVSGSQNPFAHPVKEVVRLREGKEGNGRLWGVCTKCSVVVVWYKPFVTS